MTLNPNRVKEEIAAVRLFGRWQKMAQKLKDAWKTNREVLFALALDEGDDEALANIEALPEQLKALQKEIMNYRRGIMDIAFSTGV